MPDALARRIERAQALGTAQTVRRLGRQFEDDAYAAEPFAGGWLIFAPKDVPLWGVNALGFEGAVDEAALAHIEGRFHARGLPTSFELCPFADRTLDAQLEARGYDLSPSCEVWVREVNAPFERASGDVEIVPVDKSDDAAIDHFADTVAAGYGVPNVGWNVWIGRFAARKRDAFLARIDGETAGGGVLVVEEGLGRLVFMSTLPAFRRRGVQRALMEARLDRAREQGADLIFVQCVLGSPTARNAQRLGFRLHYTRTRRTRSPPACENTAHVKNPGDS